MTLISRYAFLVVLILLLGTQACRQKEVEKTDAELVKQLQEKPYYEQLLEYSRKIGVGKVDVKEGEAPVLKLLEEIGFGHQPSNLKHLEKVKPADSVRLRQAGWALIEGEAIEKVVALVEPPFPTYQTIKNLHIGFVARNQMDSLLHLGETLNAYRWIHRQAQGAERMILVNTQGAYLIGMDSTGREEIRMRTIVGKNTTPTPQIDTYATQIITYPYWNVPKSIATKEMLPRVKQNMAYLGSNNIEVIDAKGERIDPYSVNWEELSEENFPYRFRQDTGEDNSLGLLKIDIKNPLAIYLHDTNARYLFNSGKRWRSHGCVRVQKPVELANYLAGKKILENDFLQDPDEDHPPKTYKLEKNIPVFIFHLASDVNEFGQLMLYGDPYKAVF
ncbi:hypothetical protein GCM10027275_20740 [Rhabdobacter roseus]|uniref:L,D-TPase catalytic domain-containing protein n=1 Tax=Rhabdobacter roseus TaxID=1655419 RepID=A0A840TQL8_9BACT|nr:L,D-transpeptidase family protein [Rhabdobacter roseus]MBB5284007.1 hypothetical protein [Rhabdobacter roseus]